KRSLKRSTGDGMSNRERTTSVAATPGPNRAGRRHPDRMASRVEVAEYLQVAPKTLAEWAAKGVGPRYTRLGQGGAATRYRWSDVEAWLAKQHQGGDAA